ncbi:MAG: AmmeMemoRadiSam system radical SAM enzyme [candidate division KSB1 bacterium]|nr:AmmeMemoRadiSam system radical SAM enzyme [candidate division KSB1 bacterium]
MKRTADFFVPVNEGVMCTLCPHACRLGEGEWGKCGVRSNENGVLVTHVYESAIAVHVDPIEKKPLFHVFPGSASFSIAAAGCNFSCEFCQNYTISQLKRRDFEGTRLPAKEVVRLAIEHGCRTISCTYTEPTVYYEYAYEIARLAAEREIPTVFVTNGFINPEPLRKIAPFLAAANVDLKGWSEEYYRRVCGGELKPVLNTLRLMKKLNIWVEVTTLAVPGYSDDDDTFRNIAAFIANELGKETPWHISRFHPDYRFTHIPATLPEVLYRARQIGQEAGLHYVYCGNLPGGAGESTFCSRCGSRMIERYGFRILENKLVDGKCPHCAQPMQGIGMDGNQKN